MAKPRSKGKAKPKSKGKAKPGPRPPKPKPLRRGAENTALTSSMRDAIIAEAKRGYFQSDIAGLVGIHVATLKRWLARGKQNDDEIAAWEAARERAIVDREPLPECPERTAFGQLYREYEEAQTTLKCAVEGRIIRTALTDPRIAFKWLAVKAPEQYGYKARLKARQEVGDDLFAWKSIRIEMIPAEFRPRLLTMLLADRDGREQSPEDMVMSIATDPTVSDATRLSAVRVLIAAKAADVDLQHAGTTDWSNFDMSEVPDDYKHRVAGHAIEWAMDDIDGGEGDDPRDEVLRLTGVTVEDEEKARAFLAANAGRISELKQLAEATL